LGAQLGDDFSDAFGVGAEAPVLGADELAKRRPVNTLPDYSRSRVSVQFPLKCSINFKKSNGVES
jgi:hypothetical protein